MPGFECFDTQDIAPSRRLEYWNDLACNTFTPIVADATDIRHFSPSLIRGKLGDLRIGVVSSSPSIVHHGREHVARTREALFFLQVQLTGNSVNRQDGREAVLSAGDFTVFDATRPYQMVFQAPNKVLVIGIPAALLQRQVASPESIVARRMQYEESVNQLLSDFAYGLWRQCLCAELQQVASNLSSALLNLIGSAYARHAQPAADSSAHLESLRLRIIHFIEDNLGDSDLSPAKIAAMLRTSPRYVHTIFSRGGETVSQYIRRRRLEECARLLSNAPRGARTISDIAFDYGFASSTNFGKVFREQYGVTPTEYRRQHAVALQDRA
jgi:AraC-like DNA-binding protein